MDLEGEDETRQSTESIEEDTDTARNSHNKIEKRRRDKMNGYITALGSLLSFSGTSAKTDKLTVLRHTVRFVRSLQGSLNVQSVGHESSNAAWMKTKEFQRLVNENIKGFLFVVNCADARIMFAAESVSGVLGRNANDLTDTSFLAILNPDDIPVVKEQLAPADLCLDTTSEIGNSGGTDACSSLTLPCQLYPGARRAFYCRLKQKTSGSPLQQASQFHRYQLVSCVGYVKKVPRQLLRARSQPVSNDSLEEKCSSHGTQVLIALARLVGAVPADLSSNGDAVETCQQKEFSCRLKPNGKFLTVPGDCISVTGFLPCELIGTSIYEYCHENDLMAVSNAHGYALRNEEPLSTPAFRFRTKLGDYAAISAKWQCFRNPATKQVDFIVVKLTRASSDAANSPEVSVQWESIRTTLASEMPSTFDSVLSSRVRIGEYVAAQYC